MIPAPVVNPKSVYFATVTTTSGQMIVDTSGQWSLSHAGVTNIVYDAANDTLTATDATGTDILSRVKSATLPIFGGWGLTVRGNAPHKGSVVTILDDATYFVVNDVPSADFPGQEYGSYTWVADAGDPNACALKVTSLVDTSGQPASPPPTKAMVASNSLTLSNASDSLQFGKIAP